MSEINQLIQQLDNCETTAQLPQIVKQLNKCILQTLSSTESNNDSSNDYLLEAFRAMARKILPTEESHKNNASNSKAISLIIFDNIRQLLIKVDSQKLSLNKEIISWLLFMTIGSATENKCKIIELIVKISDSKSVEHLLNERFNTFIIKSFLNKLKDNCKKTNDPFDERNAIIFEWLLSNMYAIDDHIHDIFPLTMRMIDEFSLTTRLVGLKALHRIVTTCWPQLRSNGADLLVFERLKNLLYNKEIEVLELVFECVYQVIENYDSIEEHESNKELIAFNRNDQIMNQLINNISLSSDVKYRIIHLKFIDRFLIILKSSSIKYCKSYIKVLCDIIEEPICRKNFNLIEDTIDSLNLFMKMTWIAIKEYFDKCLLSLLKLSINLNESDLSADMKRKLILKIIVSITTMKNRDKNSFALFSEMVNRSDLKNNLNELILHSLVQ